jgi:membrane associated rhomboid family serine protease
MILFAICSAGYLLILLSIRPTPLSLKAELPDFSQHAMSIRASLLLGLALLGIFLVSSNFTFLATDSTIIDDYAMRGGLTLQARSPLRGLAHCLLHIDLQHLLANLGGLGLLSVYERRVGTRRFLAVLIFACLTSALSAFFYQEDTRLCGISGGLFGLAAAYFVDERAMTTRDWLLAIVYFLAVIGLMTLDGELRANRAPLINFQIDHLGHFLGALGAVIYCRLRPLP